MRVVFAGPSLHGAEVDLGNIVLRPPAAHGDVLRAVLDGANVIGLIDGAFEAVASVWHKEILHALGVGAAVVGGASMGALRAAECAAFGMEPVGQVARAYLERRILDDAAVAITHGPVELGSPPLVEALVDCVATLDAMQRRGALTPGEACHAEGVAEAIHYKDRTVAHLAATAFPDRAAAFEAMYRRHRLSIKAEDAKAVVARVLVLPDRRGRPPAGWHLSQPATWLDAVRREMAARPSEPT